MVDIVKYQTLNKNDRTIVEMVANILRQLTSEHSTWSIQYQLAAAPESTTTHIKASNFDNRLAALPAKGEARLLAVVVGAVNYQGGPTVALRYTRGNNGVDGVGLSHDQAGPFDDARQSAWLQAVATALPPMDWNAAIRAAMGPEREAVEVQRHESLRSLERLAAELTTITAERVDAAEVRLHLRRQELEGQHRARIQQLEELQAKLRSELEAKHEQRSAKLAMDNAVIEEALKVRREQLVEREKSLDDRDSKHARRGIRSEMKKAFKDDRFKVTTDTQKMRWPLHGLFITLCTAFLVGAILAATHIPEQADNVVIGWAIARSALLGLAFGTTALFYIRWMNSWFERHAAEEFRLKRLELDIDRASWVVETLLDATAEGEGRVTPELIDRLTRGLFDEQAAPSAAQHPVDQLATLLRAAAAIDVQLPGGSRLGFDGKKLAKVERE